MRLILVRHGQTILNQQGRVQGWCDSPLTDLGVRQAKATKKALEKYQIDVAYSSYSERAIDTAEIIIEGRNIELQYDKRLKEINFGAFEAGPDAIKDIYKDNYNRDYTRVGGENREQLKARQQSFINDLYQRYDQETILLVSHGFAIWELIVDLVYDGQTVNIPMKNACYNVLEYKEGKWEAIILNEVGELE